MAELVPWWREAPWLIVRPVALLTLTVIGLQLLSGRAAR